MDLTLSADMAGRSLFVQQFMDTSNFGLVVTTHFVDTTFVGSYCGYIQWLQQGPTRGNGQVAYVGYTIIVTNIVVRVNGSKWDQHIDFVGLPLYTGSLSLNPCTPQSICSAKL